MLSWHHLPKSSPFLHCHLKPRKGLKRKWKIKSLRRGPLLRGAKRRKRRNLTLQKHSWRLIVVILIVSSWARTARAESLKTAKKQPMTPLNSSWRFSRKTEILTTSTTNSTPSSTTRLCYSLTDFSNLSQKRKKSALSWSGLTTPPRGKFFWLLFSFSGTYQEVGGSYSSYYGSAQYYQDEMKKKRYRR